MSRRVYATTGWILSALFAARVVGQFVQVVSPQPFLPPAQDFQGSNLPYGVLLATQLAILATMVAVTGRLQRGALRARKRTGIVLGIGAALYMAVALGRIAVGLAVAEAPAWFRAWIPASFHVVLAAFVTMLCLYHLRQGRDKN
jgi:hypothetical protein